MGESYLGEFEYMVLLVILRLGEGAYGVAVMDELDRRIGRRASRGATYMTLDRMETKGLVTTHLGEPTAERGGRAKRLISLTAKGIEAVRRSHAAFQALTDGLEPTLDGAS